MDTDDECSQHTYSSNPDERAASDKVLSITEELKTTLNRLKACVESISGVKDDRAAILQKYKSEILPPLLKVRAINRESKLELEKKHISVRKINDRLQSLHNSCQNIEFELAYLNHEVDTAKDKLAIKQREESSTPGSTTPVKSNGICSSYFDPSEVAKLDHDTRLKLVEEEERRRRVLCEKLESIATETGIVEQICEKSQRQLDEVKPYIRQLIEKVGPYDLSSIEDNSEQQIS